MDIKNAIETLLEKLKADESLKDKFLTDPVKTFEELTGLNLPDDKVDEVVATVKAKFSLDKLSGLAGGLFGK